MYVCTCCFSLENEIAAEDEWKIDTLEGELEGVFISGCNSLYYRSHTIVKGTSLVQASYSQSLDG